MMSEAVFCGEVVFWFAGCVFLDNGPYLVIVRIGEEHRLDIGVLYVHVDHPVVFLLFPCELVLLDLPLHVVIRMGADHKPVLGPAVHCLGVDIIVRTIVLH